ncbi:MAG: VWA domain-containing protein, partial [Nostocaceae cyanobacterium]|nr:VWA domain-containing protein [Nostocaceae cyanobacterium]
MSNFKAEIFQNQFLPQGSREVNAIMTISVEDGEGITATLSNNRVFGVICDTSGSMGGNKIHAVKYAMSKVVSLLPEDAYFFIVTGSSRANVVYPVSQATSLHKQQALAAIKNITANGGTLISTWLEQALAEFQKMPQAVRQALLLTDGQNDDSDSKKLDTVLQ